VTYIAVFDTRNSWKYSKSSSIKSALSQIL